MSKLFMKTACADGNGRYILSHRDMKDKDKRIRRDPPFPRHTWFYTLASENNSWRPIDIQPHFKVSTNQRSGTDLANIRLAGESCILSPVFG